MSTHRRWHWQIDELEEGPDYEFLASFAAEDAQGLHTLVREHLPEAYVLNDVEPRPGHRAHAKLYSSYLDRSTYERLRGMKVSGTRQSIWFHGQIEVFDQHLSIKHVLSGGMYEDTDLVLRLVETHSLTMKSWVIGYNGYEWAEVARGGSARELLSYLLSEQPIEQLSLNRAPQPPAGVEIDERRTVSLLRSRPHASVDFVLGEFNVSVARELLESISANAPKTWSDERERLALIAGARARKLLADGEQSAGLNSAYSSTTLPADADHFLLQLFERGLLFVTRLPGQQPLKHAHIHYRGLRSSPLMGMGFVTVSDGATAAPFLRVNWWVS